MRERLRELLAEIEDINMCIQQGCVDPANLECFKDADSKDHNELMATTDKLISRAHEPIEKLYSMMKEQ